MLWTDDWDKAVKFAYIPRFDEKKIGVHSIFQITEIEMSMLRKGERPIKFSPVVSNDFKLALNYGMTESELQERILNPLKTVSAAKREVFIKEFNALTEKYKVQPFTPNVRYNADGDQLEVYLTDELSYCDPAGPRSPGIMIMREFDTKAITGVKIQCFLSRIAGNDPSRQAIIMDLEFVNRVCDMYEDYFINLKAQPHTWLPEELEFFKNVNRLWPKMPQKFLQELPS